MIQDITNGFKTLLKDFDIVDIGEVDENLNPVGSTAIQISNIVAINPGICDSVLTLTFYGMTTADADPDKTIINTLYSNIMQELQLVTIDDICRECKCQAELWYFTSAVPPSGGSERVFQIQYNLVVQDFQQ